MPSTDRYQLLLAAAAACEDKKAEDIRILALDPAESGLTDYFLICNGTNDRQNVAIADEVELRLKRDLGTYPNSVEGRREAEWILMDYVDFIVHIFSPEKRAYYGLERLRKTAVTLSVEDIHAEMKAAIAASRSKGKKAAGAHGEKTVAKKAASKRTASKSAKPDGASPRAQPKAVAKGRSKSGAVSARRAKTS